MKALKFNEQMAQAVKDGRKTQTRRPIKGQAEHKIVRYEGHMNYEILKPEHRSKHLFLTEDGEWSVCPAYKVGSTYDVDGTQIKITGIRVERLQDISEEDAIAEIGREYFRNVPSLAYPGEYVSVPENVYYFENNIWNKLKYEPSYDWNSNPWVWVIEFEKVG